MRETNKNSCSAFTLLELLFVVCVIAVLALTAIPNFVRSGSSPANACINNLRQIDAAANQYALEHHLTNGDAINFPDDLTNYIILNKYGKIPPCPSGGIYTLKKVGDKPTCSLSNAVPPHVLP
jgi:prepilin-type N-terminal cleavage/methylation domain-containing protein